MLQDLGGLPWYSPPKNKTSNDAKETFGETSLDSWIKNDPSRYLDHWQTPELVIHSEKDHRLCISEGLAAFNVLQARGIDSQFLTFPVS